MISTEASLQCYPGDTSEKGTAVVKMRGNKKKMDQSFSILCVQQVVEVCNFMNIFSQCPNSKCREGSKVMSRFCTAKQGLVTFGHLDLGPIN